MAQTPYRAATQPEVPRDTVVASHAGGARWKGLGLLTLAAVPALGTPLMTAPPPSDVRITRSGHGFTLLRNGQPYLIKGGAGDESLQTLAAMGGNSVRTYGTGNAAEKLEAARKNGVTVTLGIWLGQQSYFNYSDPAQVERQRQQVRAAVERFHDDPALLMWGLGNEMETGGDPANPAMWKEIDHLAMMIKSVDPHHPVMTVVAEVSDKKIAAIRKYAPHVDVLGVNAYGSAPSLPHRLRQWGWNKPYVLTEFGPRGGWEVGHAPWGAPLEPTSTQKEQMYRDSWQANVSGVGGKSLGAYSFTWGHKWETTATWFDMFLPDTEEKLGAVDVMHQMWSGSPSARPAPELLRLDSDASQIAVSPGSRHHAVAKARDAAGRRLSWRWEVRAETPPPGAKTAPVVSGAVPADAHGAAVTFTAPSAPGPYRLYGYVSDGHGQAATGNLPFYVGSPPA